MARVVMSGLVTDLRGKLGGTVFQKNRWGLFGRNLVIPINRSTADQEKVRELHSHLCKLWGGLTRNQRSMWRETAKLYPEVRNGKTYVLTGFLFYMKLNRNLQEIGEPINTDVPRIEIPEAFTSFSVDIVTTPGTEDIKLNLSPAIDAQTKMRVYATFIVKNGVDFVKGKYCKIAVLDHTFVSGGSIKAEYIAKYGKMPATGEKAFFHIRPTLTASGYDSYPLSCEGVGIV